MDVDAFIDSTNRRIVSAASAASASEPAWDGFGGLVLIGDSVVFREEGLFSVYSPLPPSSSSDVPRTKTALTASTSQPAITPADSPPAEEKPLNTKKPSLEIPSTFEPRKAGTKVAISPKGRERRHVHYTSSRQHSPLEEEKTRVGRIKESMSGFSSAKTSPVVQSPKETSPASARFDHFSESDAEKFKSRLVAVRSEGLPAKETMIKCAGIADDAFRLAVKKLQLGEFADAFLLAEVAESACPATIVSAKTKIQSLKQSALKRLKKSVVVQS